MQIKFDIESNIQVIKQDKKRELLGGRVGETTHKRQAKKKSKKNKQRTKKNKKQKKQKKNKRGGGPSISYGVGAPYSLELH